MEICSISLVIKKLQVKTKWETITHSKECQRQTTKIKQNKKTKFWESINSEEVEQLEVSYNSDGSKDVPKVHTF